MYIPLIFKTTSVGHYSLVLKGQREKLLERKSILRTAENELVARKQENIDLRRSQIKTRREVQTALGQLNSIKELREEYEVPEVLDFLEVQRQLQEVRKSFKRLSRQRKIQLSALKRKCKKTKLTILS